MKIIVLGCGSSTEIPMIGCDCNVCASGTPRNKRSSVSLLVEVSGKNLLIDSSPDLREQAWKNNINRVDAVLYTHAHADHVHGTDDLRSFNHLSGKAIAIYCDKETHAALSKRFGYAFLPVPEIWYRPALTPNILDDGTSGLVNIHNIPVIYFKQLHGKVTTLGYRIDNFAYSTDTHCPPDSAFQALAGVDLWVVDCLRYKPSYTHAHLDVALGWIEKLLPKLAISTHMSHEFDYETSSWQLPAGVVPAYDGMQIEV